MNKSHTPVKEEILNSIEKYIIHYYNEKATIALGMFLGSLSGFLIAKAIHLL